MNDWRERARTLRLVPLDWILHRCDARSDRFDAHKWHTRRGVLTVTGTQFMNWTLGQGGGGAIDLVMHLQQLGFGQALEWLGSHFGTPEFAPPSPLLRPQPMLALPPTAPQNLARVRRYLTKERRLPSMLFEPLIDSGDLYADARANAVFLLRDGQDRPVGAELRGTTAGAWKGMAPGSRKDLGCFATPPPPVTEAIVLCESAIDALSCHALQPSYRCLSTAGARPNPGWLPDLVGRDCPLYCGFDCDATGEAMAQSMMALHPSVQRLRPPRKDWNDVLRLGA